MPSSAILGKLRDLGIGERTVNKVKKSLCVESYRKGKEWYWRLPARQDDTLAEDNADE